MRTAILTEGFEDTGHAGAMASAKRRYAIINAGSTEGAAVANAGAMTPFPPAAACEAAFDRDIPINARGIV